MTTIQHDENGRLNAMWYHTYPEGKPKHELALYVFDADDKPTNTIKLTDEGRAHLARFLRDPICQAMEKALRSCLLATAAHVGPGHIEAYNQTREALRLIDGEDAHRIDPPEAVEWAQLTGNAPNLTADNERLRALLAEALELFQPEEGGYSYPSIAAVADWGRRSHDSLDRSKEAT